jgi:hypothetical protein
MQCGLVDRHRHFGGTCYLHLGVEEVLRHIIVSWKTVIFIINQRIINSVIHCNKNNKCNVCVAPMLGNTYHIHKNIPNCPYAFSVSMIGSGGKRCGVVWC